MPEWATTREGIEAHLSTLNRYALENSVRLHGRSLGTAYLTPAVGRLVAVDEPDLMQRRERFGELAKGFA